MSAGRVRGRGVMAEVLLDLKYAARALRRQPAFSVAVALTLALGLGLNAIVLGMMDALLMRPFQFQDYQRLVVVWEVPTGTSERQQVAPANFLHWRSQAGSIDRLVAWEGWGATLTGRDEPERLQGLRVSPGYFEVLGVSPVIGRALISTEEHPGNDRRVVIGDGLWKRRFGADPGVVGTTVSLDGVPYTIVGIAPPGFDFPVGSQMWAPLAFTPERAADRRNQTLTVLGKLAPGRSLAEAQTELDLVSRRLEQQYPDTNRGRGTSVRTLSTAFRDDSAGSFVGILQAGAGFVLLIACANLVGLFLARANDRQREFAVRTALGASRLRITRQLVTETVLLALVASVLALLFARIGLDLLRLSVPSDMAQHIEGWNNVRLDSRLVLVIPALALGLGLIVGLIPAIAASGSAMAGGLKEGARGAVGSVKRQRIRQSLVVVEIALALALLVAAGLALAGGARLANQPGGFDSQRLLTFDVPLSETKYSAPDARRQLATNLLARIEAVPGVGGAALASVLPAAGWSPSVRFVVEEDPLPDPVRHPRTGFRVVSSGYFEAMRIPIVRGRPFSMADREDAPPVAVISAALAERVWPGRDPIGKRLRLDDGPATWVTIIGVAGNVTMYNWWDGVDFTAVYVPMRQAPPTGGLSAVVRTRSEPAALTSVIRAAVGSVDSLLAIHGVRTMQEAIVASTFGLNFLGTLMAICGGFALVLSVVGVYSMMAYAVSQRMHEFGVRMALGATPRDVLRLTLSQAGALTAVGLVIGLALSVLLGQLMSSSLFGIIALDATTFVTVSLGLALVSYVAAYVPARRSLRADPATILRAE